MTTEIAIILAEQSRQILEQSDRHIATLTTKADEVLAEMRRLTEEIKKLNFPNVLYFGRDPVPLRLGDDPQNIFNKPQAIPNSAPGYVSPIVANIPPNLTCCRADPSADADSHECCQ